MGHLQVPHETQGPNSEPFRVNVGVLKNKLRSKVPAMNMALKARVRDAVALEVAPRSGNHIERIQHFESVISNDRAWK